MQTQDIKKREDETRIHQISYLDMRAYMLEYRGCFQFKYSNRRVAADPMQLRMKPVPIPRDGNFRFRGMYTHLTWQATSDKNRSP